MTREDSGQVTVTRDRAKVMIGERLEAYHTERALPLFKETEARLSRQDMVLNKISGGVATLRWILLLLGGLWTVIEIYRSQNPAPPIH